MDPIGFAGRDINLYAYVWDNPVNWVDPWGLKALVCYNKEKNRVGIILPLQYTGPGAKDPNVIKKFNIGISETWTGRFGKYNVTLYAISDNRAKEFTKYPNTIYVPQGKQLSPTVTANVCAVGGSKGKWPAQISEQAAAHEAGHLMNLIDRYDAYIFPDNTVICYPKKEEWKGSIMACPNPDRKPLEVDIKGIINSLDPFTKLFGAECGWVGHGSLLDYPLWYF